jgi:hypothetical protein
MAYKAKYQLLEISCYDGIDPYSEVPNSNPLSLVQGFLFIFCVSLGQIQYSIIKNTSTLFRLSLLFYYTNPFALVRERTVPTEPPLVAQVSANFFLDREVSHIQRDGSPTAVISIF